jgi:LPS-assembly lipoprotein
MRTITILVFSLLLTACGFHLRGSQEQVSGLPALYLPEGTTGLAGELRSAARSGGARLVENREDAQAVVTISAENLERQVRSVGSTGKVREFELVYTVSFDVQDSQGKALTDTQTLRLTRDFVFDETQVLGKEAEEAKLRQGLQRDAAGQILRRVQALNIR